MLEIFAYAIGVMYTPGPINLLGLHRGVNGKARSHIGFFIGVGTAMLILFISLGYVGLKVINPLLLPYVSLLGSFYILYIAWKLFVNEVKVSGETSSSSVLSFRDGLFMHLLNPKALLATLPVSTIQFPAAGISGTAIAGWSFVLAIIAAGAPGSYSLMGMLLGKRISNPLYFKAFNALMALMLIYVAVSIGYEHGYLALK